MGEVEERLFVDIAERAAQHAGQGQVVGGEQGEAAKGHQVLEDDVLGELQPVGAAPPARPRASGPG